MPDFMSVGNLALSALTMASEVALKGAVSATVADAYKALKAKIAQWAGNDVATLEAAPGRTIVAEMIDSQSDDEKAIVRILAEQLVARLKDERVVGLDIGQLQALEVQLGEIAATDGTGVRIRDAHAHGTFKTGRITVGTNSGKR